MDNSEKKYIGTYKVIKFYKSGRNKILHRGLTRDEAKRKTMTYKSTANSFVGFDKQFYAEKYFV